MTATQDAKLDAEANAFALELLMPEEWVRARIASCKARHVADPHCGIGCLRTLANHFGVEPEVMTIRLMRLGILR